MNGQMAANMKDIGRRISCTDRESTRGQMVENTTASTKTIRKTEKEHFTGQMVECIPEAGDRVNSMARLPSQRRAEKNVWVSGKKVKELAGSMISTLVKEML